MSYVTNFKKFFSEHSGFKNDQVLFPIISSGEKKAPEKSTTSESHVEKRSERLVDQKNQAERWSYHNSLR